MSRRAWSIQEDRVVLALVQQHGTKNWAIIANQLQTNYKFKQRSGKQCRQRYHNHLDPKINKKKWTPDQEFVMFQRHKECGNRWTQIAQYLPGRTDNTIKNHFYSTIRRSLRRMSKLVGSKNSTQRMKYIKPSTLSKIFSISEKQDSDSNDQNMQGQAGYQELYVFIKQNCSSLTNTIMEFSHFKPRGRNWNIPIQERQKFQDVIFKMVKINQIYERLRKQIKRSHPHKITADSSDGQQNSQSSQQRQENPHILNFKGTTRSKREVKPPKKFQLQQNSKKPHKKKQTRSSKIQRIQNYSTNLANFSHNIHNTSLIPQQHQKIMTKKQQYSSQSNESQVEDRFQTKQKKNQQEPMIQYFEQQQRFLIQYKQEEYNPPYNSSLAHSPGYFFNTPSLAYQTPSGGLLGMIHFNPLFPNQLDDVAVNLKRQIDNKLSGVQQKKSKQQIQIQEVQSHKSHSGRSYNSGSGSGSGSGRNINTSPSSAFKFCQ